MDIYKYAKENNLLEASALSDIEFREYFKGMNIKVAVEIGTYKGLSTAYIAQFAQKVFAFDVVNFPQKYKVWDDLKVRNKIVFNLVKSRNTTNNTFTIADNLCDKKIEVTGKELDSRPIIDALDFDFAFIDGEHTYEDVKADFEMVKKCGRVLFHDVLPKFEGVHRFAKEIGVKITENIGYWYDSLHDNI